MMKIWVAVVNEKGIDYIAHDNETGRLLAIDDKNIRGEFIEAITRDVRNTNDSLKLVRFEVAEEELRFCPTCGSTSEVGGDCPHCNPPVGEIT